MEAELFVPGGSLKIIAGTSGASVTNVWLPSDAPPKMIPSPFRVTGISLLLTR
jgi:hypothetical protein